MPEHVTVQAAVALLLLLLTLRALQLACSAWKHGLHALLAVGALEAAWRPLQVLLHLQLPEMLTMPSHLFVLAPLLLLDAAAVTDAAPTRRKAQSSRL